MDFSSPALKSQDQSITPYPLSSEVLGNSVGRISLMDKHEPLRHVQQPTPQSAISQP